MRFVRPSTGAFIALAVLIIIGVFAVSIHANGNVNAAHSFQNVNNVTHGGYGIPLTQSGTPAFTSDDVRNYLNTHPFAGVLQHQESH